MSNPNTSASAVATSRNPANGEFIANYAFQAPTEVERILDAGAAAFRLWRATPMHERVAAYRRLSATLRERSEVLAALITSEMGKTIAAARAEVE
jgi:succinate-semialdehyde dehydrogenase